MGISLLDYICSCIDDPSFISVTGGGGKTSLLLSLSEHYSARGKSVLLTTTTKFQSPEFFDWKVDSFYSDDSVFPDEPFPGPCRVLFGKRYEKDERKWCSPDIDALQKASKLFDVTVSEADGARRLPLKIHTDRDPVIPGFSTFTIAVMGISAIGKPVAESVFGGFGEGCVDSDFLKAYIADPRGILKGNPSLILINGAEEASQYQLNTVENAPWPNIPVVAGSIRDNTIVKRIR